MSLFLCYFATLIYVFDKHRVAAAQKTCQFFIFVSHSPADRFTPARDTVQCGPMKRSSRLFWSAPRWLPITCLMLWWKHSTVSSARSLTATKRHQSSALNRVKTETMEDHHRIWSPWMDLNVKTLELWSLCCLSGVTCLRKSVCLPILGHKMFTTGCSVLTMFFFLQNVLLPAYVLCLFDYFF